MGKNCIFPYAVRIALRNRPGLPHPVFVESFYQIDCSNRGQSLQYYFSFQ